MSKRQRILITGAAGQVGGELQRSFKNAGDVFAADRNSLDLTSPSKIRDYVREIQPTIILNAAAYTAVDKAESESDLAMAVNATASGILAEEALKLNCLLVQYSTDYVFDGSKQSAWTEEDVPNPLNVYGKSKLAGEQAIRQVGGKYLIFRTSWVYGPRGRNFLLTMLRLFREREKVSVVDDQYGAPTSSIAIAEATDAIVNRIVSNESVIDSNHWGLYHLTCSGSTSWCGFAREILARSSTLLEGKTPQILAIPSSAYPTPAARPMNSRLANDKLKDHFNVELPSWQNALQRVIDDLVSSPA